MKCGTNNMRRAVITVAGVAVVLSSASLAVAQPRDITARTGSKPGALPITSWWVYRQSRDNNVTAGGWTSTPSAHNASMVHLTGGATPPGGTMTATITHSRNPDGGVGSDNRFVAFDYTDAAGKYHPYETSVDDPIACTVVAGGATGTTFLGYPIPAGEFGYFYQQWAPQDAQHEVGLLRIDVGPGADVRNFRVIPNTFSAAPGPLPNLTDTAVPLITPGDGVWDALPAMYEALATGQPGIGANVMFDAATGAITLDYSPSGGLGGGMSSSIVAFTSAFEPTLSDESNVTGSYDDGAPYVSGEYESRAPIPSPTPGPAALLLAGSAALGMKRGRRRV